MLDLTALLATGRPSDSLADFLGSGELMSDRVRLVHIDALLFLPAVGYSKMGYDGDRSIGQAS